HFMAALVDYQTTNLHSLTVRVRLDGTGASQQGFHPKLQLARTKGFSQVVVSARFVTSHFVIERVVRRQEKRGGLHPSFPDAFQQFEAGHARHGNVEDKTVKPAASGGFQRRHATFALLHLEAKTAKILRQEQSHIGLVVNNQKSLSGKLARYL